MYICTYIYICNYIGAARAPAAPHEAEQGAARVGAHLSVPTR